MNGPGHTPRQIERGRLRVYLGRLRFAKKIFGLNPVWARSSRVTAELVIPLGFPVSSRHRIIVHSERYGQRR
jgi:hypothetical protein